MLTTIVFLAVLTVSVVIHELAHYFNARSVGVPVRAFSVGIGPILYRKQWRGTEWRISLLPLGGYVDLPGLAAETDEEGNLHHPTEGLATKNLWQKLWVLIGGVIANALLAVLLLAVVTMLEPNYRALTSGATPQESGTMLAVVVEGSHAAELGLQDGDVVQEINGIREPNRSQVQQAIREGDELAITVLRDGETLTFARDWPPANADDTPVMLGVQLAPLEVERIGFFTALGESARFIAGVVPATVQGFVSSIGQAFTGQRSEEVVGPVGMVGIVGQAARTGIIPVLFITAIINVSLAIFNLMPIPGLDGGRMLIATIIAIRGKPFKPGQEEFIHFLGFMAIIAFVVLITFGEVSELFRGG